MAGILDYIGGRESGGNYSARNPSSSAGGKYQFIDSTWVNVVRRARPDLANLSDREIVALKTRNDDLGKQVQEQAAQYHLQADIVPVLQKNGIEPDQKSIYLSWFAGPQGAVKILKSDPNTPISDVMGEDAVKANANIKLGDKSFKDFTVSDVQNWAGQNKGGVAQGATGSGATEGDANTNDVLEAGTPTKSPTYSNRDMAFISSMIEGGNPKEVAPLQIPNLFAAQVQAQKQQAGSQQTSPYGAIGEEVEFAKGGILSVYGV
jgi:hypothetical protein